MEHKSYEKRGYLSSDFRLFHLVDRSLHEFEYHYHDFEKIIVFLSGNVTYMIEGKSYVLEPYDILLVGRNDIHKPTIDFTVPYERIVMWIHSDFLDKYSTKEENISYCFERAKKEHSHAYRINSPRKMKLFSTLTELETSLNNSSFGKDLYSTTLFLQFMILLNRALLYEHLDTTSTIIYDEKIIEILHYINLNLDKEITVEDLSSNFYLSKYHMMRKFKESTGYTIHNYITSKRLLKAMDEIKRGIPITKVCYDCGFKDYSTFSRSFKSMFGFNPSSYKKNE